MTFTQEERVENLTRQFENAFAELSNAQITIASFVCGSFDIETVRKDLSEVDRHLASIRQWSENINVLLDLED